MIASCTGPAISAGSWALPTAAAPPAAAAAAATARGRGSGGLRGRRRPQQAVGLVELELVAAAVLLGGALDVGDPFAEAVGVVDRLARDQALALDRLGLVEEPLHLQLGLVGVAGVGALVPDPDAHLEEADRVGVAEVEVLQAGLDEPGHDRQLLRQAAVLRHAGHPGGELLLGRVVAGVGRRARRRRPRRRPRLTRRPVRRRRAGRGRRRARRQRPRRGLRRVHGLQEGLRGAAVLAGGLGCSGRDRAQEHLRAPLGSAAAAAAERARPGRGGRDDRRRTAARRAGRSRRRRPAASSPA